jgi:hypothetical protein
LRITQKSVDEAVEALEKEKGVILKPNYWSGRFVRFANTKGQEVSPAMTYREAWHWLAGLACNHPDIPFRTEYREIMDREAQNLLFISTGRLGKEGKHDAGNLLFDAIARKKVGVTVVAHLKLADGYGEAYIQVPCGQTDLVAELKALDQAIKKGLEQTMADGLPTAQSQLAALIGRLEAQRG